MMRCSTKSMKTMLINILCEINTEMDIATKVAEALILNEFCGYSSHGIMLMSHYVNDAKSNAVRVNARPIINKSSDEIIHIEGNRAFGVLIIESIIEQVSVASKNKPMIAVRVTNAHHVGRLNEIGLNLAGAPHNLFIVGFCNFLGKGARVAPPLQGSRARLCTNPMLLAFPVENSAPFVLDMSTTVVAEGSIAHRRALAESLPEGMLVDRAEQPVTDPNALYTQPAMASLAPLGYPLVSHKGYGLAVFVEAMIGVLGGANYVCDPGKEGNGLFILALNPAFFDTKRDAASMAAGIVQYCYKPENEHNQYRYPGLHSLEGKAEIWDKELTLAISTYNEIVQLTQQTGE